MKFYVEFLVGDAGQSALQIISHCKKIDPQAELYAAGSKHILVNFSIEVSIASLADEFDKAKCVEKPIPGFSFILVTL